jgi:protein-S-isoprenylcysteine O-methyltransferase Ste14
MRIILAQAVGNASRISHALFWTALVVPGTIGVFAPGLAFYDDLLGLPGLPAPRVWLAAGALLLFVGTVLMAGANRDLIKQGREAPAFRFTERLVTDGPYGRTRNPMSSCRFMS